MARCFVTWIETDFETLTNWVSKAGPSISIWTATISTMPANR